MPTVGSASAIKCLRHALLSLYFPPTSRAYSRLTMPLYENRPSPARHDVKIDRRQRLLREGQELLTIYSCLGRNRVQTTRGEGARFPEDHAAATRKCGSGARRGKPAWGESANKGMRGALSAQYLARRLVGMPKRECH